MLGGPLVYLPAALGLSLIPVNRGFVESADGVEIFLVSNGVHVDFLVQSRRQHVTGPRSFRGRIKVSTAINAVLWRSASLVHAQYVDWHPSAGRVRLSESAYRELCEYLEASFRKDENGAFVLIPGKGYGDTDNFYEAVGSYHAFNTCNLWTNRGLKKIGVRTALWSPFAQGILRHLPGAG